MEFFIETIEKDILDTAAVRNSRPNISKEEKEVLKEIRSWNKQTVRAQDIDKMILNKKDRLKLIEVHFTNLKKFQVRTLTCGLITGFSNGTGRKY